MPRLTLDPAEVTQLPHTWTQTIPADYLDDMGHMNVMWYTHLFSMGFVGLMEHMGVRDAFLGEHGGGSFALESHIRYLSEVRVGQTVRIYSRLIGRTEKRFHAMHFMFNQEKQDISATYEMVSSYVNLTERRTAPLPPHVSAPMDQLIADAGQLSWPAPVCGSIAP